ncbi:MAG: hypothetical protein ABJB69_06830 [Spartobacteria bacterium]
MILISLRPLRFKKFLASLTPGFGPLALCAFAQPVFLPVQSTPYDRQMTRVRSVLATPPAAHSHVIPMLVVNQWMTKLRGLPYHYSLRWKTPAEINAARAGDCKGKAFTLYQKMHAIGAHNLRFVIGKHRAGDVQTHAWLEWETVKGTYLLNLTFNYTAATETPDNSNYIPLYAYDGARKYCAVESTFAAQNWRGASPPATSPLRSIR